MSSVKRVRVVDEQSLAHCGFEVFVSNNADCLAPFSGMCALTGHQVDVSRPDLCKLRLVPNGTSKFLVFAERRATLVETLDSLVTTHAVGTEKWKQTVGALKEIQRDLEGMIG